MAPEPVAVAVAALRVARAAPAQVARVQPAQQARVRLAARVRPQQPPLAQHLQPEPRLPAARQVVLAVSVVAAEVADEGIL